MMGPEAVARKCSVTRDEVIREDKELKVDLKALKV